MKLEIQITEEEIRAAIERKVRRTLDNQMDELDTNLYIKQQIKTSLHSTIDALVAEALADSVTLRDKIAEELERKLRAQLSMVLKKESRAIPHVLES